MCLRLAGPRPAGHPTRSNGDTRWRVRPNRAAILPICQAFGMESLRLGLPKCRLALAWRSWSRGSRWVTWRIRCPQRPFVPDEDLPERCGHPVELADRLVLADRQSPTGCACWSPGAHQADALTSRRHRAHHLPHPSPLGGWDHDTYRRLAGLGVSTSPDLSRGEAPTPSCCS